MLSDWQTSLPISERQIRTRFAPRLSANKVRLRTLVKVLYLVHSASEFDRRALSNRKWHPLRCHFLFDGGSDENRTRVQKSIHTTFSVGSQSIEIPASERRVTGFPQGSFLMRDRYTSDSRFTCTTNLTHGVSRSPLTRYGRQY